MKSKTLLSIAISLQILAYTSHSHGGINYKILDEEAKYYQGTIISDGKLDRKTIEESFFFLNGDCSFDPKYTRSESFIGYKEKVTASATNKKTFLRFAEICQKIF